MFGLLRSVLAIMVMCYHLFAAVLPLGIYPVFGFYVISGYLMTLVVHRSYGYSWRGKLAFLVNRFFRIFPLYWAAAALSLLLILYVGADNANQYHKSLYLPDTLGAIAKNVSMGFFDWYPNSVNPRLVPSSWAITVEMTFYLFICLGLSKNMFRVSLWILASLLYVGFSFKIGAPWNDRYFPVPAASLPFSLGAAIFFLSSSSKARCAYSRVKFGSREAGALILLNCLLWIVLGSLKVGPSVEFGFYINLVLFVYLVFGLSIGDKLVDIEDSLDDRVGKFSYPIYLLHWQIGLFSSFVVFGVLVRERSLEGLLTLIISFVLVFFVSAVLIYFIDRPVQALRKSIKESVVK